MRGEDTPIPMPLRGVDKTQAQSKQRRETTPDAENVRSVGGDKRMRLTQRPGMEKHYAYAMPGPVRVVATIVTANKSVTYEATEDEIESNGDGRTKHALEWKAFSSQKKDTRNVQVAPLSENVYTLSGNVIEKRNASGLVQWAFTVPVANKAFRLSPMAIGPDEAIHVAVDGGASGSNGAAIYRVRQKELDLEGNTEPILEWEYRVDGWIRELKMDGGELKALVQFDAKAALLRLDVRQHLHGDPATDFELPGSVPVNVHGHRGGRLFVYRASGIRGSKHDSWQAWGWHSVGLVDSPRVGQLRGPDLGLVGRGRSCWVLGPRCRGDGLGGQVW
jgi:hypothetical protein